jgi:hypothetical protein
MDYTFFSTTSSECVAVEFASSAERHVIFEVQYVRACSSVDVEMVPMFPAEKEVLFPPCTGLSLVDQDQDDGTGYEGGEKGGKGTGRMKVSPVVAN